MVRSHFIFLKCGRNVAFSLGKGAKSAAVFGLIYSTKTADFSSSRFDAPKGAHRLVVDRTVSLGPSDQWRIYRAVLTESGSVAWKHERYADPSRFNLGKIFQPSNHGERRFTFVSRDLGEGRGYLQLTTGLDRRPWTRGACNVGFGWNRARLHGLGRSLGRTSRRRSTRTYRPSPEPRFRTSKRTEIPSIATATTTSLGRREMAISLRARASVPGEATKLAVQGENQNAHAAMIVARTTAPR